MKILVRFVVLYETDDSFKIFFSKKSGQWTEH